VAWLLATEVVLVVLDVIFNFLAVIDDEGIREMFNVARELSLGNWFSSVQTAGVALVLFLLFMEDRAAGDRQRTGRGWGLLSALFLYVAVDDGVHIHERVAVATADFFTLTADGGAEHSAAVDWIGRLLDAFPSYPWQVLLGPFLVIFGVLALLFLRRNLPPTSLRWVYWGFFLYAAAQAQDFVEGLGTPYERLTEALGLDPYTIPHFAKVGEEYLEMVGTTLILYAFLRFYTGRGRAAETSAAGSA